MIPDIHYTPARLHPPTPGAPLDMTDSALRSVSPIHLQYLFNMGIRGSASFSILKDGELWGLVACHNETPRRIPYEIRVACRTLAAALSREIKGKEEAEGYRQRLRLRSFEDDTVRLLAREGALDVTLGNHVTEIQRLMNADGVAVLRGKDLTTGGACPPRPALRELARWVLSQGPDTVQSTDRLPELHPPADPFGDVASGLLSLVLAPDEPWIVLWFRAEQIETLNWAGNPHKDQALDANEMLTPRASFDLWKETVRGRSRPWTLPELEGATRLRGSLLDIRQNRRLVDLNRQLTDLLRDKDTLLQQKEFLMGEVNHRVQNSLQLVASFLAMQARSATEPPVAEALDEARRRLLAVGLVHRRLYKGDQVETIDAARYIDELCLDAVASMGEEWRRHVTLDLAPVMISTDRAVDARPGADRTHDQREQIRLWRRSGPDRDTPDPDAQPLPAGCLRQRLRPAECRQRLRLAHDGRPGPATRRPTGLRRQPPRPARHPDRPPRLSFGGLEPPETWSKHPPAGEMAEWSKATVSKTVRRASVSWVRIPLSPPENRKIGYSYSLRPAFRFSADRVGVLAR